MSEWMDIETAPKDLATDVLVWGVSRNADGLDGSRPEWFLVFWLDNEWCIKYSDQPVAGTENEYVHCTVPSPVGWMILPAPPASPLPASGTGEAAATDSEVPADE